MLQAQAAALELAAAEPAWGDAADAQIAALGGRGARARIHADPARPARGGQGARPRPSASTCCCRWPRPRTAGDPSAPRSRPWWPARRRQRRWRPAASRPTRRELALLRELAGIDALLARGPRDRRPAARARRPLRAPGAGRRPAAHAGDPAHRPQPARLRPLPHPQRLRGQGRCAPGRAAARTPRGRRPCLPGKRSRWCCGAPTT